MKTPTKTNLLHNTEDTIAAVSTPVGEGGIGIVRLSGKKALTIADKIFVSKEKSKPSSYKTHTMRYGHIVRHQSPVARATRRKDKIDIITSHESRVASHEIIDEVILTVMRAPKSYTREDVVEINCHGGIICLRKVLDLVLSTGARLAEPGEFTKRAFLNGRIDLVQAEGVLDVIRSRTENSAKIALRQLEGRLSDRIRSIKENLLDVLSQIEARIDFSEEDIKVEPTAQNITKLEKASTEIKKLIDDSWKGVILREGIMCVICGKPNVGKSSLMNALLRRNRAIVTPLPGTTRDAIEEEINLDGIPVSIVDTAGISRTSHVVERHGIQRSKSYVKMADIILFILDLGSPWSKTDEDIFKRIKRKNIIIIGNKNDLKRKLDLDKVRQIADAGTDIIEISLRRRKGMCCAKVEKAILRKIWRGDILHPEGIFITTLRHRNSLNAAYKNLEKAVHSFKAQTAFYPEITASIINEAIFHLGSILGDTIEEDILGRIFSEFCIGK
ncbi:MAG: tRNA uridine-5-carboxymethylaminomethyl(34) synthesis GTPase MnmE [Candidatus Omnitrophica bacterium]|nr:tRNA uridine-5-carboxymethylaminomethyl(34) synthesis GTPase MnmE [Candidatus Omnitrophota bacterium]